MQKIILAFLFLTASSGLFAQAPRVIDWDNLISQEIVFDDPFEKLSESQIYDLSYLVKIRTLKERRPESVSAETIHEIDSLEKNLLAQNVDIDGLLAKRATITELRKKKAEAVVDSLNGLHVKMAGYLLPLDFDGKNGIEFLLVPWVGACIHTPPPPPNQIVFIKYDKGHEYTSRYDPVWVEGTLRTESLSKELFLVDGKSNINLGYAMTAKSIEEYKGN